MSDVKVEIKKVGKDTYHGLVHGRVVCIGKSPREIEHKMKSIDKPLFETKKDVSYARNESADKTSFIGELDKAIDFADKG